MVYWYLLLKKKTKQKALIPSLRIDGKDNWYSFEISKCWKYHVKLEQNYKINIFHLKKLLSIVCNKSLLWHDLKYGNRLIFNFRKLFKEFSNWNYIVNCKSSLKQLLKNKIKIRYSIIRKPSRKTLFSVIKRGSIINFKVST